MSYESTDLDRVLTAIDRLAGDNRRTRWDLIATETGLTTPAAHAALRKLYSVGLIVGRVVADDGDTFELVDIRRRHPGESIHSIGDH